MPGNKSNKKSKSTKGKLRMTDDTCDLLKSAFGHLEDDALPAKMNIIREEFLNKCLIEMLNSKSSVLNKAAAERVSVSVADFMLQNINRSSRVIASGTPAGVPDPWARLPHVKSAGNFRPPSDKYCQLRPTLHFTHFKSQSDKVSPKGASAQQGSDKSVNSASSETNMPNAINIKNSPSTQHYSASAKRGRLETLPEEPDDSDSGCQWRDV